MKTRALTVALFSVLLGGAIYSARLTALTQSSDPAALVCSADGAGAAGGCAANLRSDYGKITGIPVSAFAAGLFVFLLIHMALTVFSRERRTATRFVLPLLLGAVAGAVALYYAGVSVFVLHSMCAYCLALDGLIALTIGIAYLVFRNCAHHGQKYWKLLTLKNYTAAGAAALFVLSIGLPSQRGLQLPLEPLKLPTSSENPISVVEFADFECPACKSAGRELEKLAAEYPGKLSVQIVNFPLCTDCNPDLARNVHPNACLAAKIGIVMRSRGKFEAYCHEAFAEVGALDETRLNAVVRDLGEPIDEVRAVAASTQTADVLRAELARARSAGVQTSPTLMINGQVSYGTRSIAQLRAALSGENIDGAGIVANGCCRAGCKSICGGQREELPPRIFLCAEPRRGRFWRRLRQCAFCGVVQYRGKLGRGGDAGWAGLDRASVRDGEQQSALSGKRDDRQSDHAAVRTGREDVSADLGDAGGGLVQHGRHFQSG